MYSHGQASWRTAALVGIVLLVWLLAMPLISSAPNLTPSAHVRLALIELLSIGVRVATVALAVQCGLHLSGIKRLGRVAVAAIAGAYLLLSALISSLPIFTQTVALELQRPSEASGAGALMMIESPILNGIVVPLVLAFVVSFCIARIMRARAGVA